MLIWKTDEVALESDLLDRKKSEVAAILRNYPTISSADAVLRPFWKRSFPKDADKIIPPYKWIELMQRELEAGAWKVIGEAREGGNVGLFRSSGEVRSGLVQEISTKIPFEKIIWEAPQKAQQVWFIKLLGANVNLGNIAPEEVVPLETIRLGIRGDTFLHFLGLERKRDISAPPPFQND